MKDSQQRHPSVITRSDGTKLWYLNGNRHREDGPAVEYADGGKEWYLNGDLHREDGPAVEYAGLKLWYLNGNRHREDGPAVEYADGRKEWRLNGSSSPEVRQRIGEATCLLVDPRGYSLMAYQGRYYAGCRAFTFDEAIAHWSDRLYPDRFRGMQYVAAIQEYEESKK